MDYSPDISIKTHDFEVMIYFPVLCKLIGILFGGKECYFVTGGLSKAREWSMANTYLVFKHLQNRGIFPRSRKYVVRMGKNLYKNYEYGENKRRTSVNSIR